MDPLSVTASVLQVTTTCLKTIKTLDNLRTKYQIAGVTIAALCSESILISASLSQIQNLFLQDNNALATYLRSRPELSSTLDSALTGCMLVFACLDDEISKLSVDPSQKLDWKTKARLLWNEDLMKEYLSQIRGQQAALTLLIQGLQMQSLAEITQLLQNNSQILDRVASDTRSLRAAKPRVRVPESVIVIKRPASSILGRNSITTTSTIDDREFAFDDIVVNSKAYRRVLLAAHGKAARRESSPYSPMNGDLIDLSTDADTQADERASSALEDLKSLHISLDCPPSLTSSDTTQVTKESETSISQPKTLTQDQPRRAHANFASYLPSPKVEKEGALRHLEDQVKAISKEFTGLDAGTALQELKRTEEELQRRTEAKNRDGSSPYPIQYTLPPHVPPTYEETWRILVDAREAVLISNDSLMQLNWAQDALRYIRNFTSNEKRVARTETTRPGTPTEERQLRADAMSIVGRLSRWGHPKALFLEGEYFEFGLFGYPFSWKAAYQRYWKAFEKRCNHAAFRVGMMFERNKNMLDAMKFYEAGAARHEPGSLYRLGMIYLKGEHGKQQDLERGIHLLRESHKLADESAPQGPYFLGLLHCREMQGVQLPDGILPYDLKVARMLIEKSAFLGYRRAQLKLGEAYEWGLFGCPFDSYLSLHYYRLAAWQGEPAADFSISKWLLCGSEGVFEANERLAYIHARRAAEERVPAAVFAIGYYHEIGIYVPIDLTIAKDWYTKAVRMGNKDAAQRLAALSRSQFTYPM